MKLSVIILNYNVRYFLELCILSVLKAIESIDAEIIVVDNNSSDDSCEMVQERFPNVILIQNKDNVGFAKANNQAVAIAKGEYVCILNPDTVVGEKTFLKIIETLPQLKNTGIIGPRLIGGTGVFLPESKRNIPSPLVSLRKLFGIKIGKVNDYYADHLDDMSIGAVEVLVGAFMWMKKETYQNVGGFDEDYFMYGEDIDLSYTIKKKGLNNYYLGDIVVLHYKGESTVRNKKYIKRFYGAMRLFYRKHFKNNRILDLIVSVGIHLLSLIYSISEKKVILKNVDHYFLISNNINLQQKLISVLNKDITLISIESVNNLGNTNIEIIFDSDYISYDQMLEVMYVNHNDNLTYKIKPTNCNYIIGSNFVDGKGEVVSF